MSKKTQEELIKEQVAAKAQYATSVAIFTFPKIKRSLGLLGLMAIVTKTRAIMVGLCRQVRLDARGETVTHIEDMHGFCICSACVRVARG